MARIVVTGSADGLGLMAARLLLDDGHEVTLHARNGARADDARRREPRAPSVVVGDLASIAEMRDVAAQANRLGRYDAVIHNAGVGYREPLRVATVDGLAHITKASRGRRCPTLRRPERRGTMDPRDEVVIARSGCSRSSARFMGEPLSAALNSGCDMPNKPRASVRACLLPNAQAQRQAAGRSS